MPEHKFTTPPTMSQNSGSQPSVNPVSQNDDRPRVGGKIPVLPGSYMDQKYAPKFSSKYLQPAQENMRKFVVENNLKPNMSELVSYYANKKLMQQKPQNVQPQQTMGIPDTWDYKTAQVNPQGETLEKYPGAVGWTPYGEAYYGGKSPLSEWANSNRMSNAIWSDLRTEDVSVLREQRNDLAAASINSLFQGKFGEAFSNGIQAFSTTFTDIIPKMLSPKDSTLDTKSKYFSGDRLAAGSRAVGETIMGFGLAIDALTARPTKQFFSAARGQQDILVEEGGTPAYGLFDTTPFREQQATMDDGLLKSALAFEAGVFENVSPAKWIVNTIRASQIVEPDVWWDKTKQNWQAGRVMYSSFIDPAVRQEYKRRYLAGENPYLLELELQNPLAEAAGELIFDPLNFIGKAEKAENVANAAKKSARYLGEAASEVSEDVAKITKATDVVDDDLVKLADNLGKTNERITRELDNLDVIGTSSNIEKKVVGRGLAAMTPNGQRNHMNRLASQIISNDLAHVNGDPDLWFDIAKARAGLASKNPVTRQQAIIALGKAGLPLENVLSEGSLRFSQMLDGMFFDEAGKINSTLLNDIKKIQAADDLTDAEKVGKVLETFDKPYQKALEKAFPKLREAENASNFQKVFGPLEKIADREGVVGGALGWVNKQFSKVWMGLSPGFASRNWLANKFQIFIDFGAEGLGTSFKLSDNSTTLGKVFGGNIPEFMAQGYGAAGKFVEPVSAGEKIKFTDWFANNLKRSGIYESRDRQAVSAFSIKQSWAKGKGIVLDTTDLRKAGVAEEKIKVVENILDMEYGNWDIAKPLIYEALGEDADFLKTFQWVSDEDKTWMRNYDVLDTMVDGIRGATSEEEALKVVDDLEAQLRNMANSLENEQTLPDLDLADGSGFQFAEEMKSFDQFSSSEELTSLFGRHKTANKLVEESMDAAVMSFDRMARQSLSQVPEETLLKVFGKNNADEIIDDIVNSNPLWQKVRNGSQSYLGSVDDAASINGKQKLIQDTFTYHISALRKKGAGAAEIEEAYKILGKYADLGEIPADANPKQIATYLYEQVWWPQQRIAFAGARDEMLMNASSLIAAQMNAILEVGGEIPPNIRQKFSQMTNDFMEARKLDNAIIGQGGKVVQLTEGSFENYKAVVTLAHENGIDVSYMALGKKNKSNELLNVVKKYTGNDYEFVEDVPVEVLREALEKRKAGQESFKNVFGFNVMSAEERKANAAVTSDWVSEIKNKRANAEYIMKNRPTGEATWMSKTGDIPVEVKEYRTIESKEYAVLADGSAHPIDEIKFAQAGEQAVEKAADVGQVISEPAKIYQRAGETVSNGVPYAEAMPELKKRLDAMRQTISENWGKKTKGVADQTLLDALEEYGKGVKSRAYDWRTIATDTAKAMGDFILHDYGDQRNIDLILGMIYPYQFWYSRTYSKWLKRIVQNPQLISRYVRYKETMAKIHAGMPDYWKYQLNTNELFGMDSEHPLYFNLEATLNPLNGITGTDFDDPAKRVNWWTSMLDGLGRFGPSINPVLQYGTAFMLMAQGEEEAAAHWAGRMLQQTSTINTIGAMTGNDWLATTEFDPAVNIFSGGEDVWMRSRIGRAAWAMQEDPNSPWTPEEIFDGIYQQEGPIWDEAKIRAIQDRGWGQLASYFFGVGFKPRSQSDMQIDIMYDNMYRIMNMKETMTPGEYKEAWNQLNLTYPFMDTVLISKKAGAARDTAYTWSILGRIPPGQTSKYYDAVGLNGDLVDKFYQSKGNMTDWSESDQQKFMSAVLDLGAVLEIPIGTTQQDWNNAKAAYANVTDVMKIVYGKDIEDKIDAYWYTYNYDGRDAADAYLAANPEVDKALDFKNQAIEQGPPQLQAYYSSLTKISSYYMGGVYWQAEQRYGSDIRAIQDQYFALPENERKAFLNKNPQLREYWDYVRDAKTQANQQTVDLYRLLPEGMPATVRGDFNQENASTGAQELFNFLQTPQDPMAQLTPQDWVGRMGQADYELAVAAFSGQQISYSEKQTLERYALLWDISYDRLLQYTGISQGNVYEYQNMQSVLQNNP